MAMSTSLSCRNPNLSLHKTCPSSFCPSRVSFKFGKFPPSESAIKPFSISCTIARDYTLQMEKEDNSSMLQRPDAFGRFGKFGGKYVPETLMCALTELESAFKSLADDEDFQRELDGILRDYVGRESPLYFAERLTEHYKHPNGKGPEIYLKREDLNARLQEHNGSSEQTGINPNPFTQMSSSSSSIDETLTLIPGIPYDVSSSILSFIPFSHHSRLKSTCKSWESFLSSETLIPFRQNCLSPSCLSHLLCIFPQDPSLAQPYLFDPRHLAWRPIPPMPCNPHAYGLSNFIAISMGPHIYVLGGSLFDTRSFPIDRPCSSSSIYRFDVVTSSWERLSPMLSARGSFACAAVPSSGQILVAGGGSRHAMFGAAGSRMSSVERYEVGRNEWMALDGLPRFRAGCVGFLMGDEEDREFWVMGGYGESRTLSGVFPVDEYYRDGVVLELKSGGKWREIGDMWEEGERRRLGNVVVVDGDGKIPGIFMLDGTDIFRYDMASNRWQKESTVPKKAPSDSSFGFVALDGELHVMSLLNGVEPVEVRRPRHHKRSSTLFIQIYHPRKKTWRFLMTKAPFQYPLDFKTAVMCTIRL